MHVIYTIVAGTPQHYISSLYSAMAKYRLFLQKKIVSPKGLLHLLITLEFGSGGVSGAMGHALVLVDKQTVLLDGDVLL